VLLVDGHGATVQFLVRLGVHVAGEYALDQARHAVADVGLHRGQVDLRQAQVGRRGHGGVGQVRRGVEQGTVEVDDDGLDGEREIHRYPKRRRRGLGRAHCGQRGQARAYGQTLASSARMAATTLS